MATEAARALRLRYHPLSSRKTLRSLDSNSLQRVRYVKLLTNLPCSRVLYLIVSRYGSGFVGCSAVVNRVLTPLAQQLTTVPFEVSGEVCSLQLRVPLRMTRLIRR